MIELRKITHAGIQKIYEWRNHPKIRKHMFNTEQITYEEHLLYWNKRLENTDDYSFLIVFNGSDVGVLKLDRRFDSYEVDIYLSPENQLKGIGTQVIKNAIEFAKKQGIKKLIAKVKKQNKASQKIFEKNNFVRASEYLLYELEVIK